MKAHHHHNRTGNITELLFVMTVLAFSIAFSLPIFAASRKAGVGIPFAVLLSIGGVIGFWAVLVAVTFAVAGLLKVVAFRRTDFNGLFWGVFAGWFLLLGVFGIAMMLWDFVIHPILRQFIG